MELHGRDLPLETRIGILARSRLLKDATTAKIVKIVQAKTTRTGGALAQDPAISTQNVIKHERNKQQKWIN